MNNLSVSFSLSVYLNNDLKTNNKGVKNFFKY